MENPKVSIITLTFNSQDVIADCLNSVLRSDTPMSRIIIVDNNSSDKTVEIVRGFLPNVKLIENKDNLGFSAGNNVAIKYAIEDESDHILSEAKNSSSAYIFFLNPDTTIKHDTLRILLETGESDPQIGIIGPKTLYPDGKTLMYAGGVLDWQNAKNYHRGMGEIDRGQYNQTEETGFASGAALFIKKEVIQKIGLLDEKYFLYYEDADWCVRAKKAGFKIVFEPRAIVYHQESTVTKKGSPNYYYYFTRNRLYFIAKFFNPLKALWLYFLETLRAIKNIVKLFNKSEKEQSLAILQGMRDFVRGMFGAR